jgi:hypothetical protein
VHRSDRTPDAYLASLPADLREGLARLDSVIAAAMPGRSRTLWEGVFWGGTQQAIIGYGDLVQPRPRGADAEWFVLGLARQKDDYSVYVNAVADGEYLPARYRARLGKVRTGSAVINIRDIDTVDLSVLAELAAEADRLCPPDRA